MPRAKGSHSVNKTKIEYYYQILKVTDIGHSIKKSDLINILGLTNNVQLTGYITQLTEIGCLQEDYESHPNLPFKFFNITEKGKLFIEYMEKINRMVSDISENKDCLNIYRTSYWSLNDPHHVKEIEQYLYKKNENIKVGRKLKKD